MKTIKNPISVVPDVKESDIYNKIIISRSIPSGTELYTNYALMYRSCICFRGYYEELNGTMSEVKTWNDGASVGYNLLDLIIKESRYYPNSVYYIIENNENLECIIAYLNIKQREFIHEVYELSKKVFKYQTTHRQP